MTTIGQGLRQLLWRRLVVSYNFLFLDFRLADKGLVTNCGEGGGGYKMGGGWGHVNFYPYKKGGGAEKVLAMLKGGHKQFWGSFYAVA